jgi:hypothetical protein
MHIFPFMGFIFFRIIAKNAENSAWISDLQKKTSIFRSMTCWNLELLVYLWLT